MAKSVVSPPNQLLRS